MSNNTNKYIGMKNHELVNFEVFVFSVWLCYSVIHYFPDFIFFGKNEMIVHVVRADTVKTFTLLCV